MITDAEHGIAFTSASLLCSAASFTASIWLAFAGAVPEVAVFVALLSLGLILNGAANLFRLLADRRAERLRLAEEYTSYSHHIGVDVLDRAIRRSLGAGRSA
jgi:hypothetical protein